MIAPASATGVERMVTQIVAFGVGGAEERGGRIVVRRHKSRVVEWIVFEISGWRGSLNLILAIFISVKLNFMQ